MFRLQGRLVAQQLFLSEVNVCKRTQEKFVSLKQHVIKSVGTEFQWPNGDCKRLERGSTSVYYVFNMEPSGSRDRRGYAFSVVTWSAACMRFSLYVERTELITGAEE